MADESWRAVWVAIGAFGVLTAAASLEVVIGLSGRDRLRDFADGPGGRRRLIDDLIGSRRALSTALLVVQVGALAVAAVALGLFFKDVVGWGELVLGPAVVVAVYLLLGLGLPGALRRYRRDEIPLPLAWLAGVAVTVTRPLIALGARISETIGRILPEAARRPSAPVEFEEDLVPLIAAEGATDTIEPAERAMIQGVLDLEELTVREIMVPRVDIVAVELDIPAPELIQRIVHAGHSRIPVYRDSIDEIVGILYAKDLLPFVVEVPADLPIERLLRPRYVVPESKRVDVLLLEMRRARVHIAIVADEYGGTAGLVTIEDILEEIVGEIQDEYDREAPLIERLDERTIVVDARSPIVDVEDTLHVRFPADEAYETLGGYVQTALGRLPREGDHFTDTAVGVAVTVLAVEGRRVRRVQLAVIDETERPLASTVDQFADAAADEHRAAGGRGDAAVAGPDDAAGAPAPGRSDSRDEAGE